MLNDCYQNLGAFSGTGLTVDHSDPDFSSAQLQFAQWFDVFVNFDYTRITANGTEIYRNDTLEDSGNWRVDAVDLSPFLGQASVTVMFDLYATAVVNRAGWYIDDVCITACTGEPAAVVEEGRPVFRTWPMPARDLLHVDASSLHGPVDHWTLHDASGRLLAAGTPADARRFTINVARFHGLAVLDLITPEGHHRQSIVLE